MKDIKNLVESIAELNGEDVISVVAIEECSELQKELTKFIRERGNKFNLIEEMADVYICLAELRTIYEIEDENIEKMVKLKIERTNARRGFLYGLES